MSKAIIFTGGGAPSRLPDDLLETGDMVIAADSGYEAAKALGIPVSLCLGDFDSTRLFSEIRHLNHEKSLSDKDESDTELALRKASSLGFSNYILVGGGGFRMDHLFSTYSLFDQYGPPSAWYTTYESLFLVGTFHRFEILNPPQTVSFIPASFTKEVRVTAKQLQWPLSHYALSMATISLSNRAESPVLDVFTSGEGKLFVCFPVADKLS
ncbi:thiamine diphosphokinase [Sphaerochaeta halotolerans]|jgi:thiamine pyrophosphokinase|uniref:Thiamine diphosphokinase n=1 Tax=Sphaerochaeta halotolerans TaxID=2293840 RepID=A0A372MFV2_9SPIR|nr:thiamine diphosphokinase [Sphaerochaeta halotolerans]MBG0766188.1 thiamine diphosphokinase [Spirochaetaceae bacterium]MDK2859173.1 thiamine pyrophosphokinae [Sphaerochaeta sp.]MDN5333414.1 thiamine pyrophosphokinae [Sphaerochaeta sp.]MXI86231.1 thiamine diphosphokinase [Sphaerochaeta halotolerans]RFU94652.1 thiamine diphosphokinase [Sphaerochaeta halotolerans]